MDNEFQLLLGVTMIMIFDELYFYVVFPYSYFPGQAINTTAKQTRTTETHSGILVVGIADRMAQIRAATAKITININYSSFTILIY